MKKVTFFCLVASVAAFAAEPPAYYKQVSGTIMTGLLERGTIDFTPGTLANCTRNDAGMLVAYHCDVTGATVVVAANGKSLKLSFDKTIVFYKRQHDGQWIHEYHFTTSYQENGRVPLSSDAELILWNYEGINSDIKGSLSLKTYGVFGSIQAADGQR